MTEESKRHQKALRFIERGEIEQIDNLLAAYPELLEETLQMDNDIPHSLVVAAAKCDRLNVVEFLVEKGADLHRKFDSIHEEGFTILHWAAINSSVELLAYLRLKGVDMNIKTSKLSTGLSKAASMTKGRVDALRYFKSIGCDVHEKGYLGNTLLHAAAFGGCLENFKVIYEEFNLSLFQPNDFGLTAAFIASGGKVPLLMYLQKSGIDFSSFVNNSHNYKNYAGWRAIHYATEKGSLESVKYLISDCGCDPNALTFQNSNCAMIAAGINLELMNYFVENWNQDLKLVNKFGENTALIAARYGRLDILRVLLFKFHVNPFITNIEGRNIYDFIRGTKWEAEVTQLLDRLKAANWKSRRQLCALWTTCRSL